VSWRVTNHAVERYIERVKPALEFEAAMHEIRALTPSAEFSESRPAWAAATNEPDSEGYLVVCDSFAFPVVNGHLTTCLTRCGMSQEARAGITQRKRGKRNGRRAAQSMHQANNFTRREAKSRKPPERLARSLFRRTELGLEAEDDNEMAPALLEQPEARITGGTR
jgi:hypothetical protein